jgi:hypothetical protein
MYKMQFLGADLPEVLRTAILRCLRIVARTSQLKYLSKSGPTTLGVVSDRLRSSIGNVAKEGILKITEEGSGKGITFTGHVGTRVYYGVIHAEGLTVQRKYTRKTSYGTYTHTGQVKYPARPFLKTALADSQKAIDTEFNKTIKAELSERGLL